MKSKEEHHWDSSSHTVFAISYCVGQNPVGIAILLVETRSWFGLVSATGSTDWIPSFIGVKAKGHGSVSKPGSSLKDPSSRIHVRGGANKLVNDVVI